MPLPCPCWPFGCSSGESVDVEPDGSASPGTEAGTDPGTESGTDVEVAPAGDGELVAAQSAEPDRLDPHLTSAFASFQILENVYDTLVQPAADLSMEPALAESWEVSDDGLTWTFTLREGVTFHDGSTFEAADVVYSYERIMDEEVAANNAYRFASVDSITAVDDQTVEIALNRATPNLLVNIGGFKGMAILPEGLAEDGDIDNEPVGTGPFSFVSRAPDSGIELAANPDWWGGAPSLAGLRFVQMALPDDQVRRIRGNRIAMVFQGPMTSLNPVRTVGWQVMEPLAIHTDLGGGARRERAIELLDLVGIPDPEARVDAYPHELSGGMRQRVVIAMALACDPEVLIADEATTALDVTTQAQITDLVAGLQERLGMAVIWITHDLGVVAGIADRVMVMYAGRIAEFAGVDELYASPRHPYTAGLLGSLPLPGTDRPDTLTSIPGLPPDPVAMPPGCAFAPRCTHAQDDCRATPPPLEGDESHQAACYHPLEASP